MTVTWENVAAWCGDGLFEVRRHYGRLAQAYGVVSTDVANALGSFSGVGLTAQAIKARGRQTSTEAARVAEVLEKVCDDLGKLVDDADTVRARVVEAENLAYAYGLWIASDGTVNESDAYEWRYGDFSYEERRQRLQETAQAVQVAFCLSNSLDADICAVFARACQALNLSLNGEGGSSLHVPTLSTGRLMYPALFGGSIVLQQLAGKAPYDWDRSQRREGRRGRRERNPKAQDTTFKGKVGKSGLQTPVKGKTAPIPRPSPFVYVGDSEFEGSGLHGQREATQKDHAVHSAASTAAVLANPFIPDAAKNLQHYLGNSGTSLDIDVNRMLSDIPRFEDAAAREASAHADGAVSEAVRLGGNEVLTFPFTSEWQEYYATKDQSENWFYATGGYSYALGGTVTVYPPDGGSSGWRAETRYEVHVADRYNWDGGKSTQIGPLTVTDKELQELHQAGLAQEYDLQGKSDVRSLP